MLGELQLTEAGHQDAALVLLHRHHQALPGGDHHSLVEGAV